MIIFIETKIYFIYLQGKSATLTPILDTLTIVDT